MKVEKINHNGRTYKVGDKVLLTDKRPLDWNLVGLMDRYLGKVVTISKIIAPHFVPEEDFIITPSFEIKENDTPHKWYFKFSDIVRKVESKHFKSYPNNYTGILNIKNGRVIEETKKEILDEKEKEYLENVIKPFKNKVLCIKKSEFTNEAFISIDIKKDTSIALPNFPKDTMYNGMEIDKKYTLKELGLFEEE